MSLTHPVDLAKGLPGLPPAPIVPETRYLELRWISESAFNPRKDFPKESIAELAESIKARGLLEPLVVRPLRGDRGDRGQYELMAGHRRLRALRLLEAEGAMCTVIEADDGEARATLIVENLQREDLGPMEEAEAFKALQDSDREKWTPQAIAAAIGKTPRFVQQRLSLVNLVRPMKDRLATSKLNVETARILAQFPASLQEDVPDWLLSQPDLLREELFAKAIPESAAKFDAKLYTGDWLDGPKKRRYFHDVEQFRQLQRPAADKLLAEIKAAWPAAELVDEAEAAKLYWADDTSYAYAAVDKAQRKNDVPASFKVAKDKCRAIVWIAGNGEIRKALGVCSKAALVAAENAKFTSLTAGSSSRMLSPAGEPKEHKAARLKLNEDIRKAVDKSPEIRRRLLLYVMVSDPYSLESMADDPERWAPKAILAAADDDARVWQEIAKLSIRQVEELLVKAFEPEAPQWLDYEWKKAPADVLAIAETLGIKPPLILLASAATATGPKKAPAPKPAARKKAAVKPAAKSAAAKKKHQ